MKWLNRFFVFLGVIFFLILLALGYLFIVDPFNIRPFLSAIPMGNTEDGATSGRTVDTDASEEVSDNNSVVEETTPVESNLSSTQKKALELVGVDPETLPTSLTPTQEACFVAELGQARVDAIVAGATPTASEFFKAKHCIQ